MLGKIIKLKIYTSNMSARRCGQECPTRHCMAKFNIEPPIVTLLAITPNNKECLYRGGARRHG